MFYQSDFTDEELRRAVESVIKQGLSHDVPRGHEPICLNPERPPGPTWRAYAPLGCRSCLIGLEAAALNGYVTNEMSTNVGGLYVSGPNGLRLLVEATNLIIEMGKGVKRPIAV